ncbi:glucose-6-phosphate 1-dehydrogenase [Rhodoblastus acidophilus]|uniref:glucose-6-phosphate dehydrogenase n=1 Tax=Rhodoblastus acidophilus TaxID=1074 RepID=UPI0022255D25|nr:glucose-6-phosphate dehydrogenase [Rhodoblastus acidophilus]MCW2285917.1 glucose-6-phosphate 1-dehydrogenase [Rhodoblastus acidophilus]MCW2334782.1 glucose-6-phosphate 1-dehydrogenase [Rhodoblastus acidophilus]
MDRTCRARMVAAPPRRAPRPADPCALVLFGATGDLTHRLVIPALYNLSRTNALPESFALIGVARGRTTTQAWRDDLRGSLEKYIGGAIDETAWRRLADRMRFFPGDLSDPGFYEALRGQLDAMPETRGNAIFYLAVAAQLFCTVTQNLSAAHLLDQPLDEEGVQKHWRRIVIEKPFGHDLASARDLNARLQKIVSEDQIFRIDHFLGKDTVRSIMAFRFGNGLFEPIWNRDRIDHVQITAAETVGVETRGKFYEQTGALRDMLPNHLLTLMSMVAMEAPVRFDAPNILAKKAEVLAAIPEVAPDCAVRGQYGPGEVLGRAKQRYRDEPNVAQDSGVETYVAMRLEIDNWRWAGVPFYLRTGKHLAKRLTEIAIRFKPAPSTPFRDCVDEMRPNWLHLRIAPDEGISLRFEIKRPGPAMDLASVRMEFRYDDWFPKEPNIGYETLIHDVMTGDQTLFMRGDMVEQTWRIVQPVLDAWAEDADVPAYASGGAGPEQADALLAREGRRWLPIEA